ncbi:MAG TPA: amino acid ABC transporter permease [Acetobacteraceae bacterium]|nr:amino acid ABC transporter permease [Acetobacteraceae bacterium]
MDYIFHFSPIFARWPLFLHGTIVTVELAAASMAIGLGIALVGAALRTFGPTPVRWVIAAYVELIRNTPLLVQLYIVFFVLPPLGLRMDSTQAAILALSLNLGAYAIEIVRAGLEATPRGQIEAGLSLGLSRFRIVRHIVMVPALRTIYPALGSQFVLQILGSSLASAIAAEELTAVGNNIMMQTFRNFEVFIVVGVIYFVLVQVFNTLVAASYQRMFRWTV